MSWMNIARVLKVLALVLFLTPWLVVSCQGSPLVEATGLDLITGDVQPSQDSPLGSMMAQAEVDAEAPDGTTDQDEQQPGGGVLEDGRWWALAGAVLIGLSLVLGFVLKPARTAALGAVVAGALALVALGGGMAWTDRAFDAQKREALQGQSVGDTEMDQFGRNLAAGMVGAIEMEIRPGYWATLAALGLGVLAAFMAMSGAALPKITVTTQESQSSQ